MLLLANAAGLAADYLIGIPFLGVYTGDLSAAAVQSLVFLPGDAVKVVAASLVASVVHRALPGRLVGSAMREAEP
ncbi:biotin transporter BioY [Microbispora sp. H10836]|uniref:biotin transporter BioY n=1 Tax=Microbispora sp. H10836 TaxID=2729106 RepID=UPI0028936661|nr:biotin transporter BioY [Microbispora sp. H10836]